eukprot:2517264-Pyramimonas_sp.AAC.1
MLSCCLTEDREEEKEEEGELSESSWGGAFGERPETMLRRGAPIRGVRDNLAEQTDGILFLPARGA